jgi:hypothetical protein
MEVKCHQEFDNRVKRDNVAVLLSSQQQQCEKEVQMVVKVKILMT